MQDFLRLSTPVGSSPNDGTILAQALHESRQAGRTYRQALEGLHGVGHVSGHLMCLLHSYASRSITMQGPGSAFACIPRKHSTEIRRCSLTQSVLQLKCLGQDLAEMEFMDPPDFLSGARWF